MKKLDRLQEISNSAARQASDDCASKIENLTNSQFDTVIEELKKDVANKDEVKKLCGEIQNATDKNKAMRDFISKSKNICQAVAGIIGRIF